MLLKVGIDPDAGLEIAEGIKGPGKLLVRQLRERCLLAVDSPAGARELIEAFRGGGSAELNQVIAQMVGNGRVLMRHRDGTASPTPIRQIQSSDEVSSWQQLADLLLVSVLRAEWLDLEGTPTTPEVASLREALNADAFERIDREWSRTAPTGMKRETIWREVFAPLAAHTTRVYMIDGYLAGNLYESLQGRDHRAAKSGAEWFLGHLARTGVRSVHLASSGRHIANDRLDPGHVCEGITAWFAGLGSGTELDLRIVDGDFAHGRRLAFDGWAGFDLHKGIASFDGAEVREQVTLHASSGLANEVRTEFQALGRQSRCARQEGPRIGTKPALGPDSRD